MRTSIWLISLSLLCSCSASRKIMNDTENEIQQVISAQPGVYGVAFMDLQTGKQILINAHEPFHAASTMKTPVMVELYKQAAAGKFSMTDSVLLKNSFKSIVDGSAFELDPADDSETELYKHLGEKRTIAFLLDQMIVVSSNLATNMLIELVDAKNVTASMRGIGAKDIQVLRGVEDNKAFEKGLNNSTTAYDLMLIFEHIAKEQFVNKTASDEMIKVLLGQHFNEIIPAELPAGTKVAHKTGSITKVEHDSGIVYLADGRKYVLVLLSKQWDKQEDAVKLMARLSGIIYKGVYATK